MKRTTNPKIVELRSTLRSRVHEWSTFKKLGLGNLSQDPDQPELERVKESIGKELELVGAIESCSNSLKEELQIDWGEL